MMKKIGLDSTNKENIEKSIINDTTGRNENIVNFIRLLNSCNEDTWTIAINGKWGTGKTFFIKQCKYVIDHYNDEDCNKVIKEVLLNKVNINDINYKTIYFDSWENDNEIDPLISITKDISDRYKLKEEVQRRIADTLTSILNLTKGGKVISDLLELIRQDSKVKNPIKELSEILDSIIEENNDRLIIFIDELDRCRPSYAVKLLERIQYCFLNKKITFVFSVSLTELSQTVKKFYGENFDGDGYLQRFFDLELPLPEPDLSNYYSQTEELKDNGERFYDYCKSIAHHFNFSLRELNRFYLRVNLIEEEAISLMSASDVFGLRDELLYRILNFVSSYYIEPYLIGLKMVNNNKFNNFIDGINDDDIVNLLITDSMFDRIINQNQEIDIIHEMYAIIFKNKRKTKLSKNNGEVILSEDKINLPSYFDKLKVKILNDISLISNNVNYDK